MKSTARKNSKDKVVSTLFLIAGIVVNVAFAFLSNRLNLPLFLDTIGTFAVSIVSGYFPGVFVAVMTNMFCMVFNPEAIYFSIVNAIIALTAA